MCPPGCTVLRLRATAFLATNLLLLGPRAVSRASEASAMRRKLRHAHRDFFSGIQVMAGCTRSWLHSRWSDVRNALLLQFVSLFFRNMCLKFILDIMRASSKRRTSVRHPMYKEAKFNTISLLSTYYEAIYLSGRGDVVPKSWLLVSSGIHLTIWSLTSQAMSLTIYSVNTWDKYIVLQ